MARKVFRKKAPRKRVARRRAPQTTLVNRALTPIPARFITKMKYSEFINTDTFGDYAFNLNSIFDPNRTGVGHQPYAFDTLATLYNRYRVIACGYRLQVAGDAASAICMSAIPTNELFAPSTISEVRENPRAKYIQQNPGAASVTLHNKCYIPSLVGRTKTQYMADDRYQALVTGSPQELALLNIKTSNTADAAFPTKVQILLEYTVEWFDIKTLGQS